MYYLGIDIATDNAGYAILSGSRDVLLSKTCKPKGIYKDSEIMKCLYQKRVTEKVLSLYDYSSISVEAPAFSFSNRMVSIGMIHGTLMPMIIETGKPIVYLAPTKWRYAILGKGNADKKLGKDFVLSNFRFAKGIDLSSFDDNQADAIMIAYFAYLFDEFSNSRTPFIFDTLEKRVHEVFFSEKVASKKKSGIMHRKNEFYFNKD